MWTIWPIFMFLYHRVHSASDVISCRSDEDCNQGRICQNDICKECIKCGLLFRKGNDCERDFNNCGACLPGYKEISTTNSSNVIKPCSPEKLKSNVCTNDQDCPNGTYCFENFCTDCFNCTLLNKLPPDKGCAKESSMCGFCIKGFYELPVTINSNVMLCGAKTPELNRTSKLLLSLINVLSIGVILLFTAVLVIKLITEKGKEKKNSMISICGRSYSPSAPPLLVSDIPDSILCEVETEKCSTVPRVTEFKQGAKVFKYPNAPYYFVEENSDGASGHSNDSNEENLSLPQSSEAEEACSLNISIHSYVVQVPSFQESNENVTSDRQFSISEDNVDSETTAEDVSKSLPQTDNSNAPTS